MPIIPNYESTRNVEAGPAAPLRNEAGQAAQDQNKIIGAVTDVTQQWSDAHDVMQYSGAKANYELEVAQIKADAELDQNYGPETTSKYIGRLEEAKAKSMEGIDNQGVAQKLSSDLSLSSGLAAIKIDAGFKQKELTANKINVGSYITSRYNDLVTATGPEREKIQTDINNQLALNVAKGTLSQAEADKILQTGMKSSATSMIFQNADKAIAELKDSNGPYSEMPKEERLTLIDKARSYKQKQKKLDKELIKEIQYQNETDIVMKMSSGETVNIEQLALGVEAGTISGDFAEIALRVVTSPDTVGAYTSNDEFSALTKQIFSSRNKQEVSKAINNILKGGGDGKLAKEDLEVLLQSAVQNTGKNIEEGRAAVTALGDWADNVEGIDRADVFREFQLKIKEGVAVQEAVQETIKGATIKAKPDFSAYPEEGVTGYDKNGNHIRVFPDGRVEMVK